MGSEIGFSEDWLRQVGKELFQDRGTLMNLQEKFVKTILKKLWLCHRKLAVVQVKWDATIQTLFQCLE